MTIYVKGIHCAHFRAQCHTYILLVNVNTHIIKGSLRKCVLFTEIKSVRFDNKTDSFEKSHAYLY